MNQQDKDRLRELAQAATPGPWSSISRGQYWGEDEGEVLDASGEEVTGAEFVQPLGDQQTMRGQAWRRDTDFIAAANPAAILSLLEENEALAKKAERYDWLRDKADYLRLKEGSPQVCLTDEWGCLVGVGDWVYPRGNDLDAAIDAAMQHKGD